MRALRGAIEKTSATIADLDVGDASSVVAELDTHADPQAIQDALKAVEQELEQELSKKTEHTPGSNDAVANSNVTNQQQQTTTTTPSPPPPPTPTPPPQMQEQQEPPMPETPAGPPAWVPEHRLGANVQPAGTVFRVWAPNAQSVTLVVSQKPDAELSARLEYSTTVMEYPEPTWRIVMEREPEEGLHEGEGNAPPPHAGCWCARVSDVGHLSTYLFEVEEKHSGKKLRRRDPWARQTFQGIALNVVIDPGVYAWSHAHPRDTNVVTTSANGGASLAVQRRASDIPPYSFDANASAGLRALGDNSSAQAAAVPWFGDANDPSTSGSDANTSMVMYQMHLGSFTGHNDGREDFIQRHAGTGDLVSNLRHAREELPYLARMGFNTIQLLPTPEFTGLWGYNPVMFFAPHSAYGTPRDLKDFVDSAHSLGIRVIADLALHHGAAKDNSLWDYDGPSEHGDQNGGGGVYFEGGGGTPWGRAFAFWKHEVVHFLTAVGPAWAKEYNIDGLRFDSIHNVPRDVVHSMVARLREEAPDCFLIAEHNPEDPGVALRDLGFDTMWSLSALRDAESLMNRGDDKTFERKMNSIVDLRKGYGTSNEYITYLLGGHDEVGCRSNGAFHDDTQRHHRHAIDQYGGRDSWHARAKVRLLYAAMVAGNGIPMVFMGAESLQGGFWHTDEAHRFDWGIVGDEESVSMQSCVQAANFVRRMTPALQRGEVKIIHSHPPKGVMVFSRRVWVPCASEETVLTGVAEDAVGRPEAHYIPREDWLNLYGASPENQSNGYEDAVLVVMNLSEFQWGETDDHMYGIPVDNADLRSREWVEVFQTQRKEFGGWKGSGNAADDDDPKEDAVVKRIRVTDGHLKVRVAKWSVHIFRACVG